MKYKLSNIQKQIISCVQDEGGATLDTLDLNLDYDKRIIGSSLKALTKRGVVKLDKDLYYIPDNVIIDNGVAFIEKKTKPRPQEETAIRNAVELPDNDFDIQDVVSDEMRRKDEIMQNHGYSLRNERPYKDEYQDDTDYRNLERDINQEIYGYNTPQPPLRPTRVLRQADLSSPEGVLRDILSKYHLNEEFIESMVEYSRYGELSPFELQNYLKTMECRGRSPLKSGEALFISNLYAKQLLDLQEQENRMKQLQSQNFYTPRTNQMQPNIPYQNPLMMGYNPQIQGNSREVQELKRELEEMKNLIKEREQEDRFIAAIRELKDAVSPKQEDSSLKDEINSLKQALIDERNKSQIDALNTRLDNLSDAIKNRNVDHSYKDDFAAVNAEMIKQTGLSLQEAIKNKPAMTLAKVIKDMEKAESPDFKIYNKDADYVTSEIPEEYIE